MNLGQKKGAEKMDLRNLPSTIKDTEAAALISLKAIDLIVNTKEWASNYKIELIGNELEKWRTKDDDSED
jgi:hypothetical protein